MNDAATAQCWRPCFGLPKHNTCIVIHASYRNSRVQGARCALWGAGQGGPCPFHLPTPSQGATVRPHGGRTATTVVKGWRNPQTAPHMHSCGRNRAVFRDHCVCSARDRPVGVGALPARLCRSRRTEYAAMSCTRWYVGETVKAAWLCDGAASAASVRSASVPVSAPGTVHTPSGRRLCAGQGAAASMATRQSIVVAAIV